MPDPTQPRCPWARTPADHAYHDHEWGVPSYDDRHLFEMLLLEGAQAGLSWSTILQKREHYRHVYAGFDPVKVARFTPGRQQKLLTDPGIVRNRLKVASSVTNAQAFLILQKEHGSFARYAWGLVGGPPTQNAFQTMADVPAVTPTAQAFSKDLKRRGFKFVGPTIMYAFMQAVGMVNDHLVSCPRHAVCRKLGASDPKKTP